MLTATRALASHDVLLRFNLAFERKFRLFAIERRGGVFDTRFVRGADRMGGGTWIACFLLEGWICWHDSGMVIEGPAAFLGDLEALAGQPMGAEIRGARSSGGEPYRAVEIIFVDPPSTVPEQKLIPIPLSAELADSARAVFAGFEQNEDAARDSILSFIGAAAPTLPILAELLPSVVHEEPAHLLRVWDAMRSVDLAASPSPTFQDLMTQANVSAAHLARQMKELLEAFRVDWDGWRDIALESRLRWAIMLLSRADISITDVARAAGYGSTDALAAAFRRATLPAPREVQQAIAAKAATLPCYVPPVAPKT